MKIKHLLYYLLIGGCAILAQSCFDELVRSNGLIYESGLNTTISLRIGVPDMDIATRSDMPEGADYELKSLWVGIFNATTGKCTYAGYHDAKDWPTEEHGEFKTIEVPTLSGESYIVAVGNPENNYGYQYEGSIVKRELLTTLLPGNTEKAKADDFTWESYKNIAIRQLALNDINTPIGNLVMSGIYYDYLNDPTPAKDWEEANEKSVMIPASSTNNIVELKGAIHLRRLISQVKFHIEVGDYTEENGGTNQSKLEKRRIISAIPQSYKVVNVPYTSWLHERKTLNGNQPNPNANSGDVIRINSTSISYDGTLKANYRTSSTFSGSQYITTVGGDTTEDSETQETETAYEFDFWMLENKRWALEELGNTDEGYYKREKERKQGDDTNSGIYTALCGESGKETMNNCAAFVEIRCSIVYTDDGLGALQGEQGGKYNDVQYRTAEAIYTVHLGGIKNDWSDFAHRRNHKYTYNIKVIDIDRILVEATEGKEDRPGIEGVVMDVATAPFELDCHYGVFNIRLTDAERTGIPEGSTESAYEDGKFPFYLRVYDANDNAFYIDQHNVTEYMGSKEEELYWSWVEFRPTTDSLTLAEYKPYYEKDGNGNDTDKRYKEGGKLTTFRLNEIADIADIEPNLVSKSGWYTVFINEYVYETTTDENENNWINYVRLHPRMCWLNTLAKSSKDKESNYIRSKYVVQQKSIQTFYEVPRGSGDVNALGVEHVNEVFGFNLRWDNVPMDYEGHDRTHSIQNNNGRHNTLLYLDPAFAGIEGTDGSNTNWNRYITPTTLQKIEGLNKSSNQYDITYEFNTEPQYTKGAPFYVTAANMIANYRDGNVQSQSNINNTHYLRIIEACMNRNRDNNGNGKIDIEEVRWYVPASSEIVDIVLGTLSLETPLLDYDKNRALQSPNGETEQNHQNNTRFHFATSNQRVLWAEEGATINPEVDEHWGTWNIPPQQIRCVRALGTNLTTDENADLTPAFTTDSEYTLNEATGQREYSKYATKIYPTYYESKNQRSYSAEEITPHQETKPLNRLNHDGFEFWPILFEFEEYSEEVQIGTETILEWDSYEQIKAGWYKPDLNSRSDTQYEGSIYLEELRDGTGSYIKENYLPDVNSYSPTEFPGSIYYDSEFWAGGTYYPQGNNYPPIEGTYSATEFKGDQYDGSRVKYNNPSGYYVPDVTKPNGSDQGWWCGFFINRVKCSPGWYAPDLEFGDCHTRNYWPNWQSNPQKEFPAFSGGTLLRAAGYYAPDKSTYSSTQFEGAEYWAEAKIGVGEPHIKTKPIYKTVTVGTWTDPNNRQGHLFVMPFNGGGVDLKTFNENHGITLNAANAVCKKLDTPGRSGWRIPTMKEASLIKIAMDNANVYKQNGLTYTKYHDSKSDYDVGNFLACSFREFGVGVVGNEDRNEKNGYYTGIYYAETEDEVQPGDWIDETSGTLIGRIACITTHWNRHYYIRCVRDLPTSAD